MVKIGSPLMSFEASGKIGERLVFSKRKSGQQARFQRSQKDVSNFSRLKKRILYNLAVIKWNALTISEKTVYQIEAKNLKISGYNFYIRKILLNPDFYIGLLECWLFNEVTGAIALDYSRYGKNGVLGPTYPTNCPVRVPSFSKKLGLAFDWLSNGQYVTVPYPSVSSFTQLSVVCWVKWSGVTQGGYAGVYEKGDNSIGRLLINTLGTILVQNGNGNFFSIIKVTPKKWHLVAYVYNSVLGKEYLYIDGVQAGIQNRTGTLSMSWHNWFIGVGTELGVTYSFNGLIDSFYVFKNALSSAELLHMFKQVVKH